MAGTLFSLALSQRLDNEGNPLINAPLYLYAANTSTPVNAYSDYGLTLLHPWPLRTDSAGMVPAFWLADGRYRARFTDEAGAVVYFDIADVQAVGPSEGSGSGSGSSVDPNAIIKTGDLIWQPVSGARSGFVRANARTIGSVSSGATERANADTQPAYEFLWNNFSDTLCPVTSGRGASATADFAANKPIATLDMRGYGPMGLDDMGNTAVGRITDGTPTTAASTGGSEKRTLVEANLPAHTHGPGSLATSSSGNHTHAANQSSGNGQAASPGGLTCANSYNSGGTSTGAAGDHSHTVTSGVTTSTGSGTALNTMSPYRLGSFYIKL